MKYGFLSCSQLFLTFKGLYLCLACIINNVKLAIQKPFDVNRITKLWKTLISNQNLESIILEYITSTKLVVMQVISSIEDEHCFSTLSFMKTKLWN
jgi:hypothetical protein